ncbi:hypothetical protein AB1E18_000706 [Capra hircus]
MALSSPGTLNLETVDGSDPDPALLPDREQWPPPCEILLDPEAEHSLDIILVGSSELSSPPSPGPRRDFIAYEVKVNQRDIEGGDVCSVQGKQGGEGGFVAASGQCGQPGFALTKDKFLECLFLYDDDGYQSYCSICCAGETLLICENPDCTRCYCFECVDTLVGPGTSGKVHAMSYWVCFLCLPFPRSGLLQRRRKWRTWLKAFYDREAENPLEMYKTVPVWKREPIRVLSLFGDIKKELTSLGFLEDGSKPGRLKHLDDVTNVVRRDIDEWGPFDLTYGSTPALGHTCDHPPGWYVYQFHRILQYARPLPGSPQPFFWMFVDNLVLTEEDLDVATRFLETDPVTIQDVRGRTVQNAVRVWSNIPAVKSRHSALVSQEELSLLAQDRQRVKPLAQGPATLLPEPQRRGGSSAGVGRPLRGLPRPEVARARSSPAARDLPLAAVSSAPRSPGRAGVSAPTMRPRSPGLLLLLLWGLQAESQEEVRAMVGSDVRLRCIYPEGNSFDLNDLYVYWQISMAGKGNADSVVTYHLSGNSSASHDDNHYKDRARLSLDSMKRGDFSLHLRNVTPQDEQKFNCLVFRKSLELEKILEVSVTLHVAANYSMPVVSGPSQDEELTFTCTSTNGYPRPNVYWINKTDNSVLDGALQNSTVSLNARGLYDVVSVLRIGRTPHVNVGCCIENVLLHQNLTSGQTETFTGTKDSITEDPVDGSPSGEHQPILGVLVVLAVIVSLAVATGWLCRSRCQPRSYTGAQVERPELALAGHV